MKALKIPKVFCPNHGSEMKQKMRFKFKTDTGEKYFDQVNYKCPSWFCSYIAWWYGSSDHKPTISHDFYW